jgi:putative flavoprotein involved in K+ transport
MTLQPSEHQLDTVVVGGGQAGLAMGHYLAAQHRDFVILDAAARVGDTWRNRWDSLRLFTPAFHSGLPGMPFPAPGHSFPTRTRPPTTWRPTPASSGFPCAWDGASSH